MAQSAIQTSAKPTPSPIESFLCGGFGGICTVLVGHPLDTVKVRLQTMPTPKAGEKPLYTGTMDCLKQTIAKEGPLGLYKGMGAPLVSIAPIFAISFMGYAVGKKLVGPDPGEKFQKWQYFIAGAISGLSTALLMAPAERIKCLLQIQQGGGEILYKGPIDCAIKLYKQGGIRSIFKGLVATLARDVPASGLYYSTYETIKEIATDDGKKEISMFATVVGGGMAGMSNWIIGMPADVLKSHLQTAPEGTKQTMMSIFTRLMKTEGPLALYKGMTPVLLRAFPANAACFVGFELCKRFLEALKS